MKKQRIKKPGFKTLSNRIWGMLVMMAVGILIITSILYTFVVRQVEKNYNQQVVHMAHELILNNIEGNINFSEIADIRTLMRCNHVIVKKEAQGQYHVTVLNRKPQIPPTDDTDKIINEIMARTILKGLNETIYEIENQSKYMIKPKIGQVYGVVDCLDETQEIYLLTYSVVATKSVFTDETPRMIVGITLFLMGTFWIAKRVADSVCKPLKLLEVHAFKIANKEWVDELQIDTVDEVASLVHSVNYMQTQLKKKDEEQQQFLQSISHDLKTPIMVIEGHAEAIKDGMYIESLEVTADIIISEAKRLEHKVGKMLYFNTLDYTLDKNKSLQDIELEDFIRVLVQKFEPLNQKMIWQLTTQPVWIKANQEQLEVAIENILDNQLRYAKETIKIEVRERDGCAYLSISNDGEPISDEKLPHIFEYFCKDKHGQFGLGLAITQKIIHHFGGKIEVSNQTEGVRFEITL